MTHSIVSNDPISLGKINCILYIRGCLKVNELHAIHFLKSFIFHTRFYTYDRFLLTRDFSPMSHLFPLNFPHDSFISAFIVDAAG